MVRNLSERAPHSVIRLLDITSRRLGVPKKRFFCPCCGSSLWRWQRFARPVGNGEVRLEPGGRLCPICRSFERTRHFALYLDRFGILETNPRFLHFAPERPLERKLRAALGPRYVTCDLMKPNVDRKEDITALTFEDDSFDFIYCSNVLEHVPDDRSAMRELYRVLARNGVAIIQVPIRGETTLEDATVTNPVERTRLFGQEDHVRYYGRDIVSRLRETGFVVEEFEMLSVLGLSPTEIVRMNLSKRELIHKCIKA